MKRCDLWQWSLRERSADWRRKWASSANLGHIHHILCRSKDSTNCSILKLLDMNLLTLLEFLRDSFLMKERENSLNWRDWVHSILFPLSRFNFQSLYHQCSVWENSFENKSNKIFQRKIVKYVICYILCLPQARLILQLPSKPSSAPSKKRVAGIFNHSTFGCWAPNSTGS